MRAVIRRSWMAVVLLTAIGGAIAHVAGQGRGQAQPQAGAVPPGGRGAPGADVYKLEETYLDWPVAAADRPYTAIDGKPKRVDLRQLHEFEKSGSCLAG